MLGIGRADSALAHLGRIGEAREMIARMKAIRPNASIAAVRRAFPFADPAADKHYTDGLRLAGLNED